MRLGGLILAAVCLAGAGCDKSPPKSFGDLQREYDAKELQTHPVGRYQFIERVNTEAGIEFRCLDTATGNVGIAFVPNDVSKVKEDSFSCAH